MTASKTRAPWPLLLAYPLALAVATASVGGLLLPSVYARETAEWVLEAAAQDWVDLIVVVPLLVICAILALRRVACAAAVLAGTMLFAAYTFAIYSFDVHFNALFLAYVAGLGLAAYGTLGLVHRALARAGVLAPATGGGPALLLSGWFLLVVAVLFALLWLADIVPALLAGAPSQKLAATGLPSNPVHVIDLALFLPAQFIGGVALVRRRPLGFVLAPVLLSFGVVMAATLATSATISVTPGDAAMVVPFSIFGLVNLALLLACLLSREIRVAWPGDDHAVQ